jgi:hypothetical protein
VTAESASTATTRTSFAGSKTLTDRFLAAVPLLSVFLWLAIVYAWESWDHVTPWLFTDELELTQLARSIADTGHAARRGEPYSFHSLYTLLTAPAWWLDSTQQAYSAVKYAGVFVMTAAVFPAYFLARLVASPRASLFAAAATGAIPALVYSSYIIEEPLAYPWATLSLFLIAKALLTRRRGWIAAAAAASLLAPLVKTTLLPIPAGFALAALLVVWSSERVRAWRSRFSPGDWAGVTAIVVLAIIILGGLASTASSEYLEVTRYWHTRVLDHALNGTGALVIGVGVLPLVAAVGTLLPAPGERPTRELRVMRSLLVAGLLLFALYTGVKGAYNQNHFATRVWERNMIYVAPLLFAATAVWLDRRRLNLLATAVGGALAAYLLAATPYLMETRFSSDTPGVAILAQANRSLAFTPTDAKIALFVLLALSLAVLVLPQLVRIPRAAGAALAAVVAVFVVGWNLTGELSASDATNSISRTFLSNIRNPTDWVETSTHGAPTLYLGQQMTDQNSEWLLEFWNPSIQEVWSLDGTAQGPGRTQTPDLRPDGALIGKPRSNAKFIVVETGIDPAGHYVKNHAHKAGGGFQRWRLYRIDPPLRLLGATTGLYADRWSGPASAYTRYARGEGTIRVTVSRREWGGPNKKGNVTVRIGTLAIGADNQPHIGRVTGERRWIAQSNQFKTFEFATPGPRFRVEVRVTPTFAPAGLLPGYSSDRRQLGAVLTYTFRPRKAAQR